MPTIQAVGLVWYEPETYDRVRALMEDGAGFPTTYSAWRSAMQKAEERFQRQGVTVCRATIHPDTFPAWCAARGLNLNASARQQFASFVAHQRYAGNPAE